MKTLVKTEEEVKTLLAEFVKSQVWKSGNTEMQAIINPCGNAAIRTRPINDEDIATIESYAQSIGCYMEDRDSLNDNWDDVDGFVDYEFIP